MKPIHRILASAAAMTFASSVMAASPQLNRILPRGAQQGTDLDVDFDGQRLKDAQEVILYDNGLTVTKLEAVSATDVKVHLKIDKLAPLGEHRMRIRCASGISELRTFWVGPFPSTQPAIDNSKGGNKQPINLSFEKAQPLGKNVTVEGDIGNEQVHYYKIDAKKGDRISVEVEGIRLGSGNGGNGLFDPYIAILDAKKFELATCDDTPLLKQDPYISMLAPKDGPFVIELRDSAFTGGAGSFYRMHVGDFPRPAVVYPLGGQCGETVEVKYLGDASGPIGQQVKLPKEPVDELPLFAVQRGVTAPSPNLFRVSPFPNVMQGDAANHEMGKALETKIEPPLAINGIVTTAAQEDFYKFEGHKGQPVEVQVWARRLGSPLDSVITIWGPKGQYLANNDDAGNPDSLIRFAPPEEGEYTVSIRDHLKAGGPEYAYRIEITAPKPSVALSIPNATQVGGPTQERQTIVVPRGNRYATLIRATRRDVNGDLVLNAPQLPDGITMIAAPMAANVETPVIFEAKADAPLAGKLCDFNVSAEPSADAKDKTASSEPITGKIHQQVELVISNPNNTAYSHTTVDKLAVAVTQEAPFELNLVQPKAPLLQNGSLQLKVQAKRKDDFKQPIEVKFLFSPPGVSAQPAQIAADKSEVTMPISASEGAPAKKWKVCVIGSANVDGALWVASEFVDLEIAQPYFTGKIYMTSIPQTGSGQVYCEITQNQKFEGKAKLQLLGLPPNASAQPVEISADDDSATFDVVTTNHTPVGQHTSLFLQGTLQKEGEDMTEATAKGGVLRIDPPRLATAGATTKPAQVAKGPQKVQSALDKLRQEQAAAEKKH